MIYLFNNRKELSKIIPRNNLISATQELELNGLYLAEVELPVFYTTEKGQLYNHKKSFDNASFFGHFDKNDKFQLYKIHTRKVDGRNLLIAGVHLFFDEAKAMNVIRDVHLVDVDARSVTNTAFQGTGWTVRYADTTDYNSIDFFYETPLDARKRIIEMYDIEFDYDFNFDGRKITAKNIYIRKKLGKWTGQRFHYGTSILNIVQEQDEAEVYTAAIGKGGSSGLEDSVTFKELSWSKDGISKPVGQDYIEIPSATTQYGYYDENGNVKPRIAVVDFNDEPDRYVLANKTYEWLKQNCVPKVSYETTIAKIGNFYLGDEIGIIYKEVDIVKTARIEKMTINLLDYQKSEVGLGDYSHFKQDNLQNVVKREVDKTIATNNDSLIEQLKKAFDADFEAVRQEMNNSYDQALIDANAEIAAAETRMKSVIDTEIDTILSPDGIPSSALRLDAFFSGKLLADTAFVRDVKALSLEAVDGDIANLQSKIITTDVITAENLKADEALINKLFSTDGFFENMTARQAFISSLDAIDIETSRLKAVNPYNSNIYTQITPDGAYFKGGAITIETSSGRKVIENGYVKGNKAVSDTLPYSYGPDVSLGTGSGSQYIVTTSDTYQHCAFFSFSHEARYLRVRVTLNTLSSSLAGRARIRSGGSYSNEVRTTSSTPGVEYGQVLNLDLGEPLDYSATRFAYVEFRKEGASGSLGIRVNTREQTDFI